MQLLIAQLLFACCNRSFFLHTHLPAVGSKSFAKGIETISKETGKTPPSTLWRQLQTQHGFSLE